MLGYGVKKTHFISIIVSGIIKKMEVSLNMPCGQVKEDKDLFFSFLHSAVLGLFLDPGGKQLSNPVSYFGGPTKLSQKPGQKWFHGLNGRFEENTIKKNISIGFTEIFHTLTS